MAHWMSSSLASAGRWLRAVRPQRSDLRREITAGLPGAISRVPDGMAAAVLAGVNPVQGLYASFAGPIAGGLSSNTRLMVITTTSAAALAAGSALQGVPPDDRPAAIPLLVIVVGIVLAAAGLARLGRYTRFVSYSVMIGFLTGIAVNIVCGQIADLTGAPAHGAYPLAKAVSVISHPSNINLASLLSGLAALVILVVLARTPVATFSTLIALVIPTVVVVLAGADSVARVGDVGGIPGGIPAPRCRTSITYRSAWSRGRSRSRPSSWSRAPASPRPHRTPTVPSRTRTRTSSRKGSATWPRGSSAACR